MREVRELQCSVCCFAADEVHPNTGSSVNLNNPDAYSLACFLAPQPRVFKLDFAAGGPGAMAAALKKLCADVEAAVKAGCANVILSDRIEMDAGRCVANGSFPTCFPSCHTASTPYPCTAIAHAP